MSEPEKRDVTLEQAGPSMVLFRLHCAKARRWVKRNVDRDASWLGGALCVDARYVDDLLYGMIADGELVVNSTTASEGFREAYEREVLR